MTPRVNLRHLRQHLQRGGLIAYPTESCFGLGCDPRNYRAVRKLLRLKRRPQSRGLILVGSKSDQFRHYLAPLPSGLDLASYWPGPTTLLLPRSRHCPRWISGGHEKLAVRVSAHEPTARLCHALGMALVSTSANRSGQRALKTAAACQRAFGTQILVLTGRIGSRRRPSTILDPLHGAVLRA